MELSEVRKSQIILKRSTAVSSLRGVLNSAYSTAPTEVGQVFAAALDQVADQQIKITDALLELVKTEDLKKAELTIESCVSEGERPALRAARSYGDYHLEQANSILKTLTDTPRDNTALLEEKQRLEEEFRAAANLHENNDIRALALLIEVGRRYNEWTTKARTAIAGAAGLAKIEARRSKLHRLQVTLQWVTLAISITALVVAFLKK
jgi:hypothetical protein